jgi:hypothetical protein
VTTTTDQRSTEETRNALKLGNLEVRNNSVNAGLDDRILQKWILNKYGVKIQAAFIWPKVSPVTSPLNAVVNPVWS